MRCPVAKGSAWVVLALCILFGLALRTEAGHTRAGYVDGCQSIDGRFVVTAELMTQPKGKEGGGYVWEYTWKDTKTNQTLTGKLQGLRGVDHFVVTYAHIFVPPDGETFAVFNTAAWAGNAKGPVVYPKDAEKYSPNRSEDFRTMPCFADHLVIYKKTGEVIKRYSINDLLQPHEWQFMHWVQGNLYWLREYPENWTGQVEPPRCGYRYYRISPDYTVLEFTAGPDGEARTNLKSAGAKDELLNYKRVVRIRLTDGAFLPTDEKPADPNKVPGRPYVGSGVTRGDSAAYVPSLDPVRQPGKMDTAKLKTK
jgi:hypothetical protein